MTVEVETPTTNGGCTLPYPDRFHAAVQYISKPPPGAKPISDDTRLLLYALNQQASVGPCKETKPWGWNVVETAKWQTWSQLGMMSSVEAMRLYVRELEEEQPDWYARMGEYVPPAPELDATVEAPTETARGLASITEKDSWVLADISGAKKPPPRYEHATALLEGKIFVVGGHFGGRYLGDVWILSLEKLEWVPTVYSGGKQAPGPPPSSGPDNPPPPQPSLPPCAGHALVPWGSSLLSVGGLTKAKDISADLPVHVLETHAMAWSLLSPSGNPPPQLGGHSATLIGSSLFIFGGEDISRRLSNTLYVLDLESMTWTTPETLGTPPLPRSAHVATSCAGRYLVIFGGGSVAHCYQDIHVLDTENMEWFVPATEGSPPSARAGHAAAALGDKWYIAGGGNNTTGCLDMLSLDMSELGTGALKWETVATAENKRSPVASEGMCILPVPSHGALVAFGGYNGKYHNDVHVFKPSDIAATAPTPRKPPTSAPKPQPADGKAAADASDDTQPLMHEVLVTANGKADGNEVVQLEAARKEAEDLAREATAARESAAHELALMRRQLVSAQNALADSEKNLEEVRAGLSEEQNKNFKLEVEVAELRQKLGHMEELEREVEQFRRQAQEAEARKGGGLW
eukprot:CAMPEP_0117679946 /NCGR_PEP_ID=MMETSP0804-20121206/18077_1 /TAXON_ID=1074897 /ORGANISM="Tetraselmis astigmatica, Strain CCMP880" /LENGTH=631 /DNA_ID=CAMNT_0005489385 /DNA_START=286 /DNA_END=2178 /DNA_ORIENTATION=-